MLSRPTYLNVSFVFYALVGFLFTRVTVEGGLLKYAPVIVAISVCIGSSTRLYFTNLKALSSGT